MSVKSFDAALLHNDLKKGPSVSPRNWQVNRALVQKVKRIGRAVP